VGHGCFIITAETLSTSDKTTQQYITVGHRINVFYKTAAKNHQPPQNTILSRHKFLTVLP